MHAHSDGYQRAGESRLWDRLPEEGGGSLESKQLPDARKAGSHPGVDAPGLDGVKRPGEGFEVGEASDESAEAQSDAERREHERMR